MKVFLSVKYHADQSNRERIEKIANALEQCGCAVTCVVRDVKQWGQIHFEPAELMRRTFIEIDSCDWVAVDLTEKGVGVGIEAGYAYAKHIPIVTIAPVGSDVSTTLVGISSSVCLYEKWDDVSHFFTPVGNGIKVDR